MNKKEYNSITTEQGQTAAHEDGVVPVTLNNGRELLPTAAPAIFEDAVAVKCNGASSETPLTEEEHFYIEHAIWHGATETDEGTYSFRESDLIKFVSSMKKDPVLPIMINRCVAECHGRSAAAGWWEQLDEVRQNTRFGKALVAEKLALIHSEISEALECVRKGKPDEHLPEFSSVTVELADALIRIFDLAGAIGLPLGDAMQAKLDYNKTRADHKPENRAAPGGKAF